MALERYLKNITAENIMIDDMGFMLYPDTPKKIFGPDTPGNLGRYYGSVNLMSYIDSTSVVVTDGVTDFTGEEAKLMLMPSSYITTQNDSTDPISFPIVSTTPNLNRHGRSCSKDGIVYIYDETRDKWLSAYKFYPAWGHGNNVENQYMKYATVGATAGGPTMIRNSTIIGLTISVTGGNQTKNFKIRKNGSGVDLETYQLVDGKINVTDANIDIDINETIQLFIGLNGAAVNGPNATLEIAWRL